MPQVIDGNGRNPVIVIDQDEVLAWLRSLADAAGFEDRAMSCVQVGLQQPFGDGVKIHNEVPKLVLMVSNISGSRKVLRRRR